MADTAAVYARIDNELKENAENIPNQLSISPSSAIQIFYSRIALKRRFPLDLQLPPVKPTTIDGISQTELDIELTKGIESLKSGRFYAADNVDAELTREFGL